MKLTKYTHACVRLEKNGGVLVIDPGTFSETAEALDGARAVLVTHEHKDHIDVAAVKSALTGNRELELFAPLGVAYTMRIEAADALIMRSITEGTKLGSMRGRPMPSIREGRPVLKLGAPLCQPG
jgi:L-ascorbate metabolism protein UlaG (beta-lactamase superfamily)